MITENRKKYINRLEISKGNYAGTISFKTADTDKISVENVGTYEKLDWTDQYRLCGRSVKANV